MVFTIIGLVPPKVGIFGGIERSEKLSVVCQLPIPVVIGPLENVDELLPVVSN